MTEQEKLEEFHSKLDSDKGLKSKRHMVMYVALITLALTLSAATVNEANTFLFKLKFLKPEGLMTLLFLANIFCFIRYTNYSRVHENTLSEIWQKRLFSDERIKKANHEQQRYEGILGKLFTEIDEEESHTGATIQVKYKNIFLFFPRLIFTYHHIDYDETAIKYYPLINKITKRKFLSFLWIEESLKWHFIYNSRETLDLAAPKIISIAALISIFSRDYLYLITDFFK